MRPPSTRANGVRVCFLRPFGPMMCSTPMSRTSRASPIIERWQRHGTASAHISTQRCCCASELNAAMPPGEFGRLHMVGVAAKRGVAPAGIGRVLGRMAQAAQRFHVAVIDAGGGQRVRQRVIAELGIVARTRHGAHIDYAADVVNRQQIEEHVQRPVGVADGADTYLGRRGGTDFAGLFHEYASISSTVAGATYLSIVDGITAREAHDWATHVGLFCLGFGNS